MGFNTCFLLIIIQRVKENALEKILIFYSEMDFTACYTNAMITITSSIALGENEIHYAFYHSSGPDRQNVNKVATARQWLLVFNNINFDI